MTIPCHLSRLYLFSILKHDMDFGQVQVMEFPSHFLRKSMFEVWMVNIPHLFFKLITLNVSQFSYFPCKKCDMDFLMSFWREFGRKWDQIRWKFHHFLSKCHENSMTWTCANSKSCLSIEKQQNLDKWHGICVDLD